MDTRGPYAREERATFHIKIEESAESQRGRHVYRANSSNRTRSVKVLRCRVGKCRTGSGEKNGALWTFSERVTRARPRIRKSGMFDRRFSGKVHGHSVHERLRSEPRTSVHAEIRRCLDKMWITFLQILFYDEHSWKTLIVNTESTDVCSYNSNFISRTYTVRELYIL